MEISATRDTAEAVYYGIEKIIVTRKELGKEQEYRVKWLGWNKTCHVTWLGPLGATYVHVHVATSKVVGT